MSDKLFSVSNNDMAQRISDLEPLLDRNDIIGYVAARNIRRLTEASLDHETIKSKLIQRYGEDLLDGDGKPTGNVGITPDNPHFEEVRNQLEESGKIKHDVVIFTLSYEDVKDKLTGREILRIDWMLDD